MYSFPPLAAAIGVLDTIITSLITFLTPVFGPASAGLGIVILTLGIRLLLLPLGWRHAKADVQRTRLAPEIQRLQQRYKSDPQRLHREMMKTYSDAGASPLAGCLPMLAQAPVFAAVFGLFTTTDLAYSVAGVALGAHLTDVTGVGIAVFGVVIVVLLVVAWLTRRTMPDSDAPGASIAGLLPFTAVGAAVFLPLAAGIYLATSTTWTYVERTTLRKIVAARS